MTQTQSSRLSSLIPVSIGIAARNEARTIGKILRDILAQRQDSWRLVEVIVLCDGCTDRTAQSARASKDRRIAVMEYRRRKGKTTRVNQFLHAARGEILVIFDADVRLGSREVIEQLIAQFRHSPRVMLVGGNVISSPAKGFFQQMISTSYQVLYASREQLRGGHNIFGCNGSCLAVRRTFARQISIPAEIICEDVYLYFSCLRLGHLFRHAKQAVVTHKLATNLTDFLRQVFRSHPESIDIMLRDSFGDLVRQEYRRPLGFYLTRIGFVFVKNPVGTMLMILVKLLCKPWFPVVSSRYQLRWYTALSTK